MNEEYGKLVTDLFALIKTEDLIKASEILKKMLDLIYKDRISSGGGGR